MIFRKSWPRFALETAIEYNIQHSGVNGGRCINVGCGTSGRYEELLSLLMSMVLICDYRDDGDGDWMDAIEVSKSVRWNLQSFGSQIR